MLPCISHVKLPSTPKQVVLQHHAQGGVAIAAVAYAGTSSPNYFTVAELPTPNVEGAPMQVMHVRAPGEWVSQLALGRSVDGADVFVVAQCCTRHAGSDGEEAVKTKVHLYRRRSAEDDDGDDEQTSPCVRYRRLPRTVAGLDGTAETSRIWTAALALNSAENVVNYAPAAAAAQATPSSSATRVVAAAGGGASGQPVCLQVLAVMGTRGALEYTVELPFLSGFAVEEMMAVPGCVERLVLRCHHALVEVDLSLCERLLASQPSSSAPLVRTNEAVTRVWRWTPRDRLTGFTLKDARVYATTEEGVVLLWDYQQGSVAAQALATDSLAQQQHPLCHSAATGVAHTGIYAPYATDFVTCGVDGSVLSWGYSNLQDALEAGVVGLSALSDFAQAAADAAIANAFPYTPSPADGDRTVPYLPQTLLKAYALDGSGETRAASSVVTESTGQRRYDGRAGASGATPGRGQQQQVHAARQAALWLGRQLTDTRTLAGTAGESCIRLSGDGNLVSVVGDHNTLRLYLCQ